MFSASLIIKQSWIPTKGTNWGLSGTFCKRRTFLLILRRINYGRDVKWLGCALQKLLVLTFKCNRGWFKVTKKHKKTHIMLNNKNKTFFQELIDDVVLHIPIDNSVYNLSHLFVHKYGISALDLTSLLTYRVQIRSRKYWHISP